MSLSGIHLSRFRLVCGSDFFVRIFDLEAWSYCPIDELLTWRPNSSLALGC